MKLYVIARKGYEVSPQNLIGGMLEEALEGSCIDCFRCFYRKKDAQRYLRDYCSRCDLNLKNYKVITLEKGR